MCGIVGFTGNNEAAPILLDGLSKLEYRGYDSAGIAVRNGDAEPEIVKAKGKLKVLKEMTNDGKAVKGACGIGHTRWATHGEPSDINSHPHGSKTLSIVHNGIIENYLELKEKLEETFYKGKPLPAFGFILRTNTAEADSAPVLAEAKKLAEQFQEITGQAKYLKAIETW